MVSCNELMNRVKEWLETGSLDAKTLVDFPWEVEETKYGLKAIYPRFPIEINITCNDEINVLRLMVKLDVVTYTLDRNMKLLVYHKFLRRNIAPLVKYVLVEDEDIPALVVDLTTEMLSKEEFNDALAVLLASAGDAINLLGLQDRYREKIFEEIIGLVKKHIEEGWGRDKIYDYLINYVGLKDKDAEEIVKSLLGERSREPSVYT